MKAGEADQCQEAKEIGEQQGWSGQIDIIVYEI